MIELSFYQKQSENSKKISIIPESVIRTDIDSISINPGNIVQQKEILTTGFENKETNLLVLSSQDFFGVKQKKRKSMKALKMQKNSVCRHENRDMVVHREHGIEYSQVYRDTNNDGILKTIYKSDIVMEIQLYVPTDSLDNVRKYIGSELEQN